VDLVLVIQYIGKVALIIPLPKKGDLTECSN